MTRSHHIPRQGILPVTAEPEGAACRGNALPSASPPRGLSSLSAGQLNRGRSLDPTPTPVAVPVLFLEFLTVLAWFGIAWAALWVLA